MALLRSGYALPARGHGAGKTDLSTGGKATYRDRNAVARNRATSGLAAQTGMRIFFADPHSPWQRGANENTNGLLRQYVPKGSSPAGLDQSELDLVATSLNDRPRKTLDYATPNEAFNSLLAKLVSGSKTPNGGAVRYGV